MKTRESFWFMLKENFVALPKCSDRAEHLTVCSAVKVNAQS